jgi:predicted nucleic acid-binding protein
MPEIVSNTGPLIALASIDQFELLQKLFGKVLIPLFCSCCWSENGSLGDSEI